MLTITIPAAEAYNNATDEFVSIKEQTLTLEHSLVSLSKWESKWEKPFLSKDSKTTAEIIDYVRCMTLTQNVDPIVYRFLTKKNLEDVLAYIEKPMTATTFSNWKEGGTRGRKEIVTAEILYYRMIAFNIPFECQKWHLNRLLTLIRVCDIKNQPQKKMKRGEILRSNAALNAARRKRLNSKG